MSQDYLERYGHGGDVWTAAVRYGNEEKAFLDYSANINPLGPPPQVLRLMEHDLSWMTRYPDPGHRQLKQLLALRLSVREEELVIGNGAAECMALLILAERPSRVGIVEPCFSEYETLSRQFGTEVISLLGDKEQHYRASAADLEAFIHTVDICFIGHPNNPTGVMYDCETLKRAVLAAEQSGTVLAVDEAFIDYMVDGEERSALRLLKESAQLVILRSLTKFYAIPGLRLGYAITSPERVLAMSGKQVSWSVNGLALTAGEAMFSPSEKEQLTAYEDRTRELNETERAWLCLQLEQLNVSVIPSETNYILCEIQQPWTAEKLQAALGKRGILIRSCAMYNGLGAGFFRLAVKDRAANEQLVQEMSAVLESE